MNTDLITQLTAMLDQWETLTAEVARHFDMKDEPLQSAYYAGVISGMDIARNAVTSVLANVMSETTKP